jgi:glyoxylase-like metal-dependent hydrolase (beta-lactamase superfamily II)
VKIPSARSAATVASISVSLIALASPFRLGAQSSPQSKLSHRFVKVADGVYHAISTIGSLASNSQIIINNDDVILIDTHSTPRQARLLLNDIRTLTTKPVRIVVNTHFHFDHTHGNEIFARDAEIIGSEYARTTILAGVLQNRTARSVIDPVGPRVEDLKKQAAAESDPPKKTSILEQIAVQEDYLAGLSEVHPTPPSMTLKDGDRLTLYRGAREIQILSFGQAHTGGDLVVYLPKERIVCTGDLLTSGTPYMTDAYPVAWGTALDRLEKIDFDTVLPGHGEVFTGKDKIADTRSYLRDVWQQVTDLKRKGTSVQDAAKLVDMRSHSKEYPNIRAAGLSELFVNRMYELMDGKDQLR